MSKMNRKQFPLSFGASSIALISLGVLLTDPFDITMNNAALMLISGLLLASFVVFAGLLWQEKPADEREAVLIDKAGRFGYLAGLSVLVLALVVQSFDHAVDSWLVIVIATMIITKQAYIHMKK
jgi:hypothetical protein